MRTLRKYQPTKLVYRRVYIWEKSRARCAEKRELDNSNLLSIYISALRRSTKQKGYIGYMRRYRLLVDAARATATEDDICAHTLHKADYLRVHMCMCVLGKARK